MKMQSCLLGAVALVTVLTVHPVGLAEEHAAGEQPLTLLSEGHTFAEGPQWLPDKGLLFTDVLENRIHREDGSVFREPSGKANGLAADEKNRLIACEQWNRRVTRTLEDGTIEVVAERYEGKQLNSPNDAAVRTDGLIFFTDPPYGLEDREKELDFHGVYGVDAPGEVRLLTKEVEFPNGLALSPDEATLYVGDAQNNVIHAFDVAADGSLSNRRTFCEVQSPDGMEVDQEGNLYTSSRDGVRVYSPEGEEIDHMPVYGEMATNVAFGGENGRKLYVTTIHKVAMMDAGSPGIRFPADREAAASDTEE
jgi:gluconolactonase